MNLFILHSSPHICATYYFDSHVIKIILEAVQMLFAAKLILDPPEQCSDYDSVPKRYKLTHKNHPVTVWVRQSKQNWEWTCQLVEALMDEWHYRYNHNKVHGCYDTFQWLRTHMPSDDKFTSNELTEFAKAMPDEYKIEKDPVVAYRNYYMSDSKAHIRKWKRREKPSWFV